MATHSSNRAEVAHMPQDHEPPSVRTYVNIFFILFAITAIEVAASWISDIESLPYATQIEIAVLILLALVKGVMVVGYYMHLRTDSRWFTGMFVGGFVIAVFMVIIFILLWTYRATLGGYVL